MDKDLFEIQYPEDERKGRIISIVVHIALLLLLLFYTWSIPEPPPGQQGVLVSFGLPDMGSGDDLPDTQADEPTSVEAPSTPPKPEKIQDNKPKPQPTKPAATPKVQTQSDPEQIRIQQQRDADEKRRAEETRKQQAEEAQRQAEEEARRKAEAEARAKAEAEQREYEEKKKQFGGLFGGGRGENNAPGNQGDPEGDPNASALSGISTGAGTIGGGLENRGGAGPPIEDRSQAQGKVVIRICVDSSGKVISADFTQSGSTTSNRTLVNLAKQNAMKYSFNGSSVDKQCGTIAYNFKVQ